MIDSADDIVQDAKLRADICIVGGGPAGITLAMELARFGKSILLLESGDLAPSDDVQTLNEGEVADAALHSPPEKIPAALPRRRDGDLGRTPAPRSIPINSRPAVDGSRAAGRSASRNIEQYYPAANALCEAGEYEYDARLAVSGGMRPLWRLRDVALRYQ